METGIEGVGEAVTGGMIAHAVEPGTGEAGHSGEVNCLNCGAELQGAYCSRCGQPAHVHRTISAFWHDILHGVLHFDGKIWRTLPLLAWRPGELTRRYIAGERANFVSPVALFLFSVFLMFAVFSLVGGPFSSSEQARTGAMEEVQSDLREELAEAEERLTDLRAERQEMVADDEPTAEIDGRIRDAEREVRAQSLSTRLAGSVAAPTPTPAAPGTEGRPAMQTDVPFAGLSTGIGFIDKSIRKAQDNPALVAYKLQTNAYKFSWALIPISVPFVWLLFLHRRRYRRFGAYDHVVFVTYSIAFMSLGLIAASLVRPLGIGGDLVELAILLVPPIHIYRQLKGAYGLGRWSALWRTFMLVIFAFMAISMFVSLLLTIGGVE